MSFDRIHQAKSAVSKSKIRNSIQLNLDEKNQNTWMFFCPLCAVSRRLTGSKNPGKPIHFVQIGLCAAVFTLATYRWFELKGLVSFIPMWIVFETLFRTRVRARIRCSECGFDPFLCVADVDQAKREVENHWKKKFEEKGIPLDLLRNPSPNGSRIATQDKSSSHPKAP